MLMQSLVEHLLVAVAALVPVAPVVAVPDFVVVGFGAVPVVVPVVGLVG